MDISFDPKKRDATLAERGLDFADAIEVLEADLVVEREDNRRDYGEARIKRSGICAGAWSSSAGRSVEKPGPSSR